MNVRNSCDGCCAGMPIKNGIHINKKSLTRWGRSHMSCQAYKYGVGDGYFAIKAHAFKLTKRQLTTSAE